MQSIGVVYSYLPPVTALVECKVLSNAYVRDGRVETSLSDFLVLATSFAANQRSNVSR